MDNNGQEKYVKIIFPNEEEARKLVQLDEIEFCG